MLTHDPTEWRKQQRLKTEKDVGYAPSASANNSACGAWEAFLEQLQAQKRSFQKAAVLEASHLEFGCCAPSNYRWGV